MTELSNSVPILYFYFSPYIRHAVIVFSLIISASNRLTGMFFKNLKISIVAKFYAQFNNVVALNSLLEQYDKNLMLVIGL